MLVMDLDRSERGRQRRRATNGRLMHCCCICGKVDLWGEGWSTWCSEKDLDDEIPIPKFCSPACREHGGPKARNVTEEMKRKAKDAEWREPKIVWKEATDRQKYAEAKYLQQRDRESGTPGEG